MRDRYTEVYVGVDPANKSAGVAMLADRGDGYLPTITMAFNPWDRGIFPGPWEADFWGLSSVTETSVARVPARVFVEVPQNGTHKSRGGVHWAAGMIVGRLLPSLGFGRRNVRKLTPNEWRRTFFGRVPADSKASCVAFFRELVGEDPGCDDEAEALAIAVAGVLKDGRELHPRVLAALEEAR